MTHEEAFLQAIREAPDDDGPRLIFADWLEERGDPRGAFIRVQCALERLDPADPARADLEDEKRALLDRHEWEWTAPLHGVASEWRFRRGFVEEMTLFAAENLLTRGETLFDSFPIQKVTLRLNHEHVAAVATFPLLARVRFLDVSGSVLRDRGVEALLAALDAGRLTGLDLRGNGLENRAVRALAASPLMRRLSSLDLSNNHALGLAGARALAQAPAAALRFLGLSNTNIGLVGLRDLLHSSTLAGLTSLQAASIGYYGLAGAPAADLADSPVLSQLTSLDLGGFPGPGGLPTLLRSRALGRLTSLGLAGCQLRDDAVRALAESPHLAGLTALDLGRNGVGPAGASPRGVAAPGRPHRPVPRQQRPPRQGRRGDGRLAAPEATDRARPRQERHRRPRPASIGGVAEPRTADGPGPERKLRRPGKREGVGRVAATGPAHVSASERQSAGAGGRAALAASPHLARLTSLHLDNNDIGDEGLHALLCSPHLTRLAELSVRTNGIGRAGADALSSMLADSPRWGRLRKLDLRGNPLSGHEQRVLEQRFGAACRAMKGPVPAVTMPT